MYTVQNNVHDGKQYFTASKIHLWFKIVLMQIQKFPLPVEYFHVQI